MSPSSPYSDSLPIALPPPTYCDYAQGPCPEQFTVSPKPSVFFLYPAEPKPIASTIESAAKTLRSRNSEIDWTTWKRESHPGHIVFCEICKSIRTAGAVAADVTTLNFNLLFEIGFVIGAGIPVIPLRDSSWVSDKGAFKKLAMLETLTYLDFQSSEELVSALPGRLPAKALPRLPTTAGRDASRNPVFLLRSPLKIDGDLKLKSTIEEARLNFRQYDPEEVPTLTLPEARRRVAECHAVTAVLLAPNRSDALVHNARCALVAGLAASQGKVVVLLQESHVDQPIDYRELVLPWDSADQIRGLLREPIHRITARMQEQVTEGVQQGGDTTLERLDLGDVAAENEMSGLRQYFVRTGQYVEARKGHARLVIGRKGTGKTAIFMRLRDDLESSRDRLVVELTPEGYQFAELREFLARHFPPGTQEHTLVAFWHYLLLTELARKALENDRHWHSHSPDALQAYSSLEEFYKAHDPDWSEDFSARLVRQVRRIERALEGLDADSLGPQLTQKIYMGDVRLLTNAVTSYLGNKAEVWLLIDNLDKSWPVHGASDDDARIVRTLLEAVRKLQHQIENEDIDFRSLVFIRSDVFEILRSSALDSGKDTAIELSWSRDAFEELLASRVRTSLGWEGKLSDLWSGLAVPHIGTEDSLDWMLRRTLQRPRDLLKLLRLALQIAITAGHTRIEEEDFLRSEELYSQELLLVSSLELAASAPEMEDVLFGFEGEPLRMSKGDCLTLIEMQPNFNAEAAEAAFDTLLWAGFLGVRHANDGREEYHYSTLYSNVAGMRYALDIGEATVVIHPGLREALHTYDPSRK